MEENKSRSWLNRPLHPTLPAITMEVLIFAAIVLLAIVTRFYDLEARVMSHDESLHTYFSWTLSQGQSYVHDPMMHGPLQFHMIAFVYQLFGTSDFTARIPAVLFSIASVWMIWYWRRYLGRAGALAAAAMMLISPYMLYYGRYVRNEAFVGLFGILMLYAILRYLETGTPKYLYFLSAALVLHFTVKETSYIYAAQLLLFIAAYLAAQLMRKHWDEGEIYYHPFLIAIAIGAILIGAGAGLGMYTHKMDTVSATEVAQPADPNATDSPLSEAESIFSPIAALMGIGALAIIAAIYFAIRGYGLDRIRSERSFDILMMTGTMILPLLTAFPVKLAGGNPLDYSNEGMIYTAAFLIPIFLIAALIGWWWNFNLWWKSAALFYGIFVVFYTTVFTNGPGFFTGLIGSLGYWLEQQGVERGSQPWYYYILIQIPMYEFLPFIGSIVALALGAIKKVRDDSDDSTEINFVNMFTLLAWWSISSIAAFSIAGEKMPWLTYHPALPMILLAGWGIGQIIDRVDWEGLRDRKAFLTLILLTVFVLAVFGTMLNMLSATPPFQGKELAQLEATATFIFALIAAIASASGLFYLLKDWEFDQFTRVLGLVFFGLLAVLTARATIRANYINYDNAKEYLVYAHSFTGVKDVMNQVEEISERTTGGKNIVVAYDDDVPWPFSWYLRDYKSARYYGDSPTRDLRDAPVIIVGDNNFTKVEAVVGNAFYRFDYVRMVWPNQDYFGLTWERINNAITDPNIRAGIVDIWLNRDFTRYAEAVGSSSMTLENWDPSDRMRMYVRKDIAAQIWNYGVGPAPEEVIADPYEQGIITLPADRIIGTAGTEPGQFNSPRGIAFAPDGSFYVADSRNNRIQHFSADGMIVNAWGMFGDINSGNAPGGTFNEPWGIAVSADGSVFVSDTWNHRVQKFTKDGKFVTMWGVFGQAETPLALWGPRGIAIDPTGRVYVADTGNKRIVVFDQNGNPLGAFGEEGYEPGKFSEPVAIAFDNEGSIYITDTWNQRVQVLSLSASNDFEVLPLLQWDINGWFGQSLDNKPFIAVDQDGHVFATDPEGYRILEFNSDGTFLQQWGEFGSGDTGFGLPSGIAVDPQGNVWVTDASNQRVMKFVVSEK